MFKGKKLTRMDSRMGQSEENFTVNITTDRSHDAV